MLVHCPKLTGNNYLIYQSSHIGEHFSFLGKQVNLTIEAFSSALKKT